MSGSVSAVAGMPGAAPFALMRCSTWSIAWATGGAFVPEDQFRSFLARGGASDANRQQV